MPAGLVVVGAECGGVSAADDRRDAVQHHQGSVVEDG